MSFTTIFIIAGIVMLAIFFLIVKLAVRWIIRLTIVGVILIAILGAGIFWWWSTRLTPKPQPRRPPAATRSRNSSN